MYIHCLFVMLFFKCLLKYQVEACFAWFNNLGSESGSPTFKSHAHTQEVLA